MISYKESDEIDSANMRYNTEKTKKNSGYFESMQLQLNDNRDGKRTEINARHQIAQSVPVATRKEQIDSLLNENLRYVEFLV